MDGKPKVQFKTPDSDKIAYGDQRSIPDVSCDSIGQAKDRLEGAGFDVSVGPTVDSSCPAGTAADTNPSGRTIKGGVVVIEVSNGKNTQPETNPSTAPTLPVPTVRPTRPRR
jgi:beta-lactam-binding protein with PASTA domain